MVRRRRVLVRVRRRRVAGGGRPPTESPSISQPGDRPALLRSGSRPLPVRWADDFRTSMSGNRPETVQWADDLRTVSGHCRSQSHRGNVRKPSGSRPVGGRFPDGFRTLRSGSRPPTGREVDDFRTWGGPGDLRVGRSGISSWPWARRRQHSRPPTEHTAPLFGAGPMSTCTAIR